MAIPYLLKFIIRTISIRRMSLSLIGIFRFLHCLQFSEERLNSLSNLDKEISRLLIIECGFTISKDLFDAYANKCPKTIKFEDVMFFTEDLEDFYSAHLFFEKATLGFVLQNLSFNEVFVDVGASIGGYAMRAARNVQKAYAFEPDARNFSILEKNVCLNNLNNIDIRRAAVSDHVGRVNLHTNQYHGRSSIVGEGEYVEVDCVSLDSVLKKM